MATRIKGVMGSPGLTAAAFVASVLIVLLILARAHAGGSGDGCVDLADYAVMQSQFTGPSCTPRQILSFHTQGTVSDTLIPEVPGEHGFVITDIHVSSLDSAQIALVQDINGDARTLIKAMAQTINLRSGIPVPRGATLTVVGFDYSVMVSGYTY